MQILILGCGSCLGVSVLGCKCEVCTSQKPMNIRRRSAILIHDGGYRILVDFGADIRAQLLEYKIHSIDAAILTHMHADHMAGIDDLRVFPFFANSSLPLYTTTQCIKSLREYYGYLFTQENIELRSADYGSSIDFKGMKYHIFEQQHGNITNMGITFGNCVYANDVSSFSQDGVEILKSTPNWIIDCISYKAAKAHIGLEEVIALNQLYSPQAVYLTNMSHDLDYYALCRKLPENIRPLYDGMVLNF